MAWRGGGDAGVVVVGGSVVVDGNAGAGNRTEQGVGAAAAQRQPWTPTEEETCTLSEARDCYKAARYIITADYLLLRLHCLVTSSVGVGSVAQHR